MFYFDSFNEFLAMGRHGAFVWSAYGIALVILLATAIAPLQRGKGIRKAILRQMRRDAAKQQAEEK
ncbi:MAG: heme exporter protein CcmD [Porticoccaceae bacterium]|nr:heme exporter protein CcmD [Porticoccaceae bacterium]